MAILSKGTTYADGTQVTATNLNALVDSATFASGAVDDSTTQLSSGAVIVKDLGIATGKIAASAVTTAKIADSNVTTAKIADSNVTKAKIENLSDYKVLGNVSGGAAAPAEVAILDEDNMASNSATSLATQQSIKAYADSKVDGTGAGSFTTLAASGDVTFDTTTLKVDSSNNRVGIGEASPAHKLDVNSGTTNQVALFESTDETAYIELADNTGSAQLITLGSGDLRIATGGSGAGNLGTSGLYITQGQDVGIGDDTPSYKLDVNGTGRFTGVLSAGSNLEVSGTIKESLDNGNLILQGGGSGGANIELYGQSHSSAPNGANYDANIHRFRPVDASANSLNIIQNGNVGINVDTPTHKFHVVGEARFGDGGAVNDDLVLKGSETATVAPGGSVSGAIITTNGTGSASGHVGVEVPANDADDGFFVATDANLDGTVDKIALKIKANGNVGIGETAPTAPLTVTSTTGGVLLPRMTTTQMNAISSPANGEMIYNTTASKFYGYAGGAWVALH